MLFLSRPPRERMRESRRLGVHKAKADESTSSSALKASPLCGAFGCLRNAPASASQRAMEARDYQPLTDFLASCEPDEVHLSFADIEQILGYALPRAAHGSLWWSNTQRLAQGRAWLCAGWRVRQHVRGRAVTFTRQPGRDSSPTPQ
jgi:hypothetical protein